MRRETCAEPRESPKRATGTPKWAKYSAVAENGQGGLLLIKESVILFDGKTKVANDLAEKGTDDHL
jgi:hypothetical protein